MSSSFSSVGITFINLDSIYVRVDINSVNTSLFLTALPGSLTFIISLIKVMLVDTASKSYLNLAILLDLLPAGFAE